MNISKLLGFGLINFLIRFALAGFLYMGVKLNPEGFVYGLLVTIVAFVVAYFFIKQFMRPTSVNEALIIAFVWAGIAFLLDVITAVPIVKVDVSFYLSELQFWTRLIVIVIAAVLAVKRPTVHS